MRDGRIRACLICSYVAYGTSQAALHARIRCVGRSSRRRCQCPSLYEGASSHLFAQIKHIGRPRRHSGDSESWIAVLCVSHECLLVRVSEDFLLLIYCKQTTSSSSNVASIMHNSSEGAICEINEECKNFVSRETFQATFSEAALLGMSALHAHA